MSEEEFNVIREIATLQGQIAAMVLKDQKDDATLDQVANIKRFLGDFNDDIVKLSDGLFSARSESAMAIKSLKDSLAGVKARLGEIDQMSNQIAQCQMEIASLKADHRELAQHIENLHVRHNKLDDRESEMSSKLLSAVDNIATSERVTINNVALISSDLSALERQHYAISQNAQAIEKSHADNSQLLQQLHDDVVSYKLATTENLETFKSSVAIALNKALQDFSGSVNTRLTEMHDNLEASRTSDAQHRLDLLEADRGVATKKFDLLERQIATFTRQLDAFSVTLKGLQLDKG